MVIPLPGENAPTLTHYGWPCPIVEEERHFMGEEYRTTSILKMNAAVNAPVFVALLAGVLSMTEWSIRRERTRTMTNHK